MSDYILNSVKTDLYQVESAISGITLHEVRTVQKEYIRKLGKTGGMRLVKTHDLFDILPNIVNSSLDMKIVAYMLKHNTLAGEVKHEKISEPIGITELANKFDTSRKKISELLKRCLDTGLIKKNKRVLVVNPYIVSPHGANNNVMFILQTAWDSNFTYDITEELSQAQAIYLAHKQTRDSELGLIE